MKPEKKKDKAKAGSPKVDAMRAAREERYEQAQRAKKKKPIPHVGVNDMMEKKKR